MRAFPGRRVATADAPRGKLMIVTSSGKTLGQENENHGGKGEAARRGARSSGAVFDRWLERKLHELFDAVAQEPIPDDLINLIVTLERKDEERH